MSWESDFQELIGNTSPMIQDYSGLTRMPYREFRDEESEGFFVDTPNSDNHDLSSIGKSNEIEGLKMSHDGHFRTYTTKRQHKWSEQEKEEIRNSCLATFVNDYGKDDFYHISDEERAELDSLSELRGELSTLRTLYRQVDKYILAMRIVFKALDMIEKKGNFLYSRDEFYEKLASGEIYTTGFMIPKLRARINFQPEVLAVYISNPELDPTDLLTEDEKRKRSVNAWDYEDEEDEETEEEKFQRLFSPEDIEIISKWLDNQENPQGVSLDVINSRFVTGYNDKKSYFGDKRKIKYNNKAEKRYAKELKKFLVAIEGSSNFDNDPYNSSRSYSNRLIGGAFEDVPEEKNPIDELAYHGSFSSDKQFRGFELLMDDRYMASVVPGTQYRTHQSVVNQKLFNAMEAAGMNVTELRRAMNLSGTDIEDNEENREATRAHNKKVEAKLVARIVALNNNSKFKKLIEKADKQLAEAQSNYYSDEE